jgi:hypothetical protein
MGATAAFWPSALWPSKRAPRPYRTGRPCPFLGWVPIQVSWIHQATHFLEYTETGMAFTLMKQSTHQCDASCGSLRRKGLLVWTSATDARRRTTDEWEIFHCSEDAVPVPGRRGSHRDASLTACSIVFVFYSIRSTGIALTFELFSITRSCSTRNPMTTLVGPPGPGSVDGICLEAKP